MKTKMTLEKKAKLIAGNHYRGKGKTAKVLALLEETIGTKCPYCGETLTIQNIVLDHAVPILRPKLKKNLYSKEELELLTNDDNKILCCETCNKAKGDLDDIEFKLLISALKNFENIVKQWHCHEKIYQLSPKKGTWKEILTRLKSGGLRFRNFKKEEK
jgi:5-methylcytosine-specific restriction endonuclease McrA